MYTLQEEVTKDMILSHLSQEEIFGFYMGTKIVIGELYKSPLRNDRRPTCGFRYSKNGSGILYMRDFSGHFWGSCFDMVMKMYGLSYGEALEKIAMDFRLQERESVSYSKVLDVSTTERKHTSIRIRIRPFQEFDLKYWAQFGISDKVLGLYNVYACECVFVNGRKVYDFEYHKELAFAYRMAKGEYKIYFPERREDRFLCNTLILQGYAQLPETGNLLVITKSMKDVMLFREFNIYAVSGTSESTPISDEVIEDLKRRFKMVVSLYDFDYTGVTGANKLKRDHGIPYLFFTNGRFGTRNYMQKDLTDFYKMFGRMELLDLIHKSYAHIKNYYYTKVHSAGSTESKTKGEVLSERRRTP